MTYTKITTHKEDAIANLIFQFRKDSNVKDLIEILGNRFQDLEDSLKLLKQKTIEELIEMVGKGRIEYLEIGTYIYRLFFDALEKELKDTYKFVKLNVDEARDLSIKYGVTSVPTFLFIQNNQVKGRVTGYMSKADLKARIEEYLA